MKFKKGDKVKFNYEGYTGTGIIAKIHEDDEDSIVVRVDKKTNDYERAWADKNIEGDNTARYWNISLDSINDEYDEYCKKIGGDTLKDIMED